MIPIQQVHEQLPGLKRLGPGLVGVFVGGTSGIGESTAREFVRYSTSPRVYLVGRSHQEALRIESEFRQLNPTSEVRFIQSDVSELRKVDQVCLEIKAQEENINFLFMTAGIFNMKGREETVEGLDRKLALEFYSRLRFTENLLPQLRRAATEPNAQTAPIARVVSVFGGGAESLIDTSDLSLKRSYSTSLYHKHGVTMNTLSFGHLAADPENKGVAFFHTRPGMVKTNSDRDMGLVFKFAITAFCTIFKPWTVSVQEVGERHIWAMTDEAFKGGQVYLLGQKSERVDNSKILSQLKADRVSDKVWEHTREVFREISDGKVGKYSH